MAEGWAAAVQLLDRQMAEENAPPAEEKEWAHEELLIGYDLPQHVESYVEEGRSWALVDLAQSFKGVASVAPEDVPPNLWGATERVYVRVGLGGLRVYCVKGTRNWWLARDQAQNLIDAPPLRAPDVRVGGRRESPGAPANRPPPPPGPSASRPTRFRNSRSRSNARPRPSRSRSRSARPASAPSLSSSGRHRSFPAWRPGPTRALWRRGNSPNGGGWARSAAPPQQRSSQAQEKGAARHMSSRRRR